MDASSQYQDSLPISSDRLLEMLADAGFGISGLTISTLRTVQDSKQVEMVLYLPKMAAVILKTCFTR